MKKEYFKQFFQVGLVVDDLDDYVKRYENDFGIGPWDVHEFNSSQMPNMTINGKVQDLRMKTAFCRSFGTQLEIIQPISESIYMDWLRQHGPGIHHVAFVLNDYQAIMADLAAKGKKPLMEALFGDQSTGFAYVDLVKELGFILELHKGKPG
jgi:methylmalonyl-CoA/ethylmalonyl-CoA epimerase